MLTCSIYTGDPPGQTNDKGESSGNTGIMFTITLSPLSLPLPRPQIIPVT